MPEATPIPNDTANRRSQNFDRRRKTGLPVKKYAPSSTAIYEARPTVNAGSRICSAITQANCNRDNSSASSMAAASLTTSLSCRTSGRYSSAVIVCCRTDPRARLQYGFQISLIESLLADYGLAAVFCAVLVHQLGVPVPAFPLLVWAGAKAIDDPRFGLYAFVLSVVAGTAGNLAWFWAGRRYGRRVLQLVCRITLSPDSCVRHTENSFERRGP